MEDQKELILKQNYDYLFILDACRYDILSEEYGDYFDAVPGRVESRGSMTKEWVKNTFLGESLDDVIYISGNPWVNSVQPMEGIDTRNVFHEIKDGWSTGWGSQVKTTRPSALAKILRETEIQHPDKKKIIHMMQPHAPYLDIMSQERTARYKLMNKTIEALSNIKKQITTKTDDSEESKDIPFINKKGNNIRKKVGHFLVDNLGQQNIVKLRRLLGIPPTPIWDVLLREGPSQLRKHYRYNLDRALHEIMYVKKALNGKMIVSADHGELLGEELQDIDPEYHEEFYDGDSLKPYVRVNRNNKTLLYGHPKSFSLPLLRHVPWLEVE